MTKRFLIILVVGLLWGNVGVAKDLIKRCVTHSVTGAEFCASAYWSDQAIKQARANCRVAHWNKNPKACGGVTTEESEIIQKEKAELESMINKAKDTCKSLGFEEGTEKFVDCGLKLYSQSVELAAKNKQQIVMMPQSSGSNTVTIYDPVRDSNALKKQGMKMLSGSCTFGIDC